MSSPQVILEDDFETGALGDTDRWIADPIKQGDIKNGMAVVKAAETDAFLWHSDKIPVSLDQQIEADIIAAVETGDTVGIWARLDDQITIAAATPVRGYFLRFTYSAGDIRKLDIIRQDNGTQQTLATVADVGKAGTAKTILDPAGVSDLGVLQRLRLTVTDEDSGVRLRGFVNNGDDKNPDISILDLGTDVGGTVTSVPCREPGFWGFEITSAPEVVGIDYITAIDKFKVPEEDPYGTRTLKQLRDDLKDEIARGGNISPNIKDAFLDRQLRLAMREVMKIAGRLPLFTQRRKEVTLTSSTTDVKILELPNYVEALVEIVTSPAQRQVDWAMVAMNETNSAIVIRTAEKLGGQAIFITYHTKWKDMLADTDRCIVPRLFDETVVLGAAKRIARRSTDKVWGQTTVMEFGFAIREMKKYLNRQRSMEKTRLRVPVRWGGLFGRDARYVDDPLSLFTWP